MTSDKLENLEDRHQCRSQKILMEVESDYLQLCLRNTCIRLYLFPLNIKDKANPTQISHVHKDGFYKHNHKYHNTTA